jgi:hypothetical protein
MDLTSLPGRPLSLDECRDLESSERFRTVVPAGVFDLADSDRRLVPAVVLVTDARVVAAGFDTDGGGWTVVEERGAGATEDETETRVRAAGERLREWAEDRRWADDPSALLDAL